MKKKVIETKNEIISWVDTTSHEEIRLEDIQNKPTKDFFTNRKHYGTVIKEDEFGIVIAHDTNEDHVDILAIPKGTYTRKKK